MIQLLLQYNSSVSQTEKAHYKTALHVACEAQSISCVQFLLDAGADPNVQCSSGRTPMHEGMLALDTNMNLHCLDSVFFHLFQTRCLSFESNLIVDLQYL